MAGYIGSKAVITSGVSASIDELNIIDGVTATTAELNILDGVTSTAAELNILDGVTSTAAELNILDGVTATATELNLIDGVTATTAELNILDGVTATAAEINLIDGGTARGTTAIVDADGVLVNDAGTMRMTTMATLATYMGTKGLGPTYTRAASAPSSPNAGDWWFNTNYNGLYIYDGTDGWITDSARDLGSGRFLTANTFSLMVNASQDHMKRMRFEPDASFSDPDFRTTVISHTYADNTTRMQAVSNTVRGVFTQANTTTTNSLAFVALATNGVAANFGNSNAILTYGSGCDHATRGVFGGGVISSSVSNNMEYITIASAGNGTDFGNLSAARKEIGCQAVANTTRGVFAGGKT